MIETGSSNKTGSRKIAAEKPARRSLVAAQEASAVALRNSRSNGPNAERAVLVAVEFTGERRKLTSAVRLARKAAAVSAAAGTTKMFSRTRKSPFVSPILTSTHLCRSLKSLPAALGQRSPRL